MKTRMEGKVKINRDGNETEVEIYVERPNNDTIKLAERHKSKIWNQCIQDGILTKKELGVLMRKRGIWDEKKDQEEQDITKEIIKLEKELYHGKDGKSKPKVSDGRNLAIEIRKKRSELRDLIAEKITLEENTADNLADNARFDFLVAHCTFYKNGNRVYKDFNEYNSKSTDEIAFEAASLLGRMFYNLDNDFEKNLPENKFLTRFNLVNEDLSLIDPNNPEQLIDITGKPIDKDGYYIDANGNRIDRDGNKITKEGTYELADYENDLLASSEIKKTSKKKSNKEESNTESSVDSVV